MPTASLNCDNPFFKTKYAGLPELVKASRPYLAKNGLSVTQLVRQTEHGPLLQSMLMHSSGQWISSCIAINPAKQDIQSLGSYLTYLRRYSYAALIGVVSSGEDDDGELAMQEVRKSPAPPLVDEKISKDQLDELMYELADSPLMAEEIMKKLNLTSFSDLKRSIFRATMTRIRELKRLQEPIKRNE